jgi:hypothetical protein
VKAYKCLNNSRFVLVVLGIFQCVSSGAVAMDVATMHGERRLSGAVYYFVELETIVLTSLSIQEVAFVSAIYYVPAFLS